MKYLTLLAIVLFSSNVYAVDYTYVKEDTKVKITSTETKVDTTSETLSIEGLEAKKASLEVSKVNALNYYNENITRLNAEIAVIDAHIVEAKKLGIVKEVIELK